RQLLTESLVLAGLGAAAGLALAQLGIEALRALGPTTIPRLASVRIDGPTLGVTVVLTVLTGIGFGLVPALRGAAIGLLETLNTGGRAATGGGGARHALVVAEVALSVILVIGAGLLVRSFWRLQRVDPGYAPDGLLAMSVELPPSRYPPPRGWPILRWPAFETFYDGTLARVGALPGVRSVALAHNSPVASGWTTRVTVVGRPEPAPGEADEARYRPVSEGFFETLGASLRAGRTFTARDRGDAAPVAIVDEAFARRYFPGAPAVGQRITIFGVPREIMGVVGDTRYRGLDREVQPTMYVPLRQGAISALTIVVRAAGDPLAVAGSVRGALRELDPDLAAFDVTAVSEALDASLDQRRFIMLLLALFAAVAVGLAAVGVYGVVSYSVAERTRELGIRMALGAKPEDVTRAVLGQGLVQASLGVAIGLLGALALTRLMRNLLFGVTATDLPTYLAIPLVLGVVVVAASWLPARRASRVDPMAALRTE
ncbi:MAG: FtsX-like permease family protein, partial [Gemmatimonadales bacterium]